MVKIRVITTGSKAKAVQAIKYQNNKRIVLKHFGSAHNAGELNDLLLIAKEWAKDYNGQLFLFADDDPNKILHLNHCSFIGVWYHFFYQSFTKIIWEIGYKDIVGLLKDLVIIRLFEPASKLRSIELMEQYFGIKHRRQSYYDLALKWLELKTKAEKTTLEFAKKQYDFTYDLLFYDVTTLYFETFKEDELRKNGFSKDNKSQQPQILIALMVTKEGFPVAYDVFSGNTFEGKTIIPVVKNFIRKNKVTNFTIIADAAMISSENVKNLIDNKINYIVGARLGNVSKEILELIDKSLIREDNKTIRLKTDKGFLICNFSKVRYRKDKFEMEKQIEKAKKVVENPSKNPKTKFTKKVSDDKFEINQELIEKTKKLLGIKGYYTNLEENIVNNQLIIERYHELYKIEQAFRISKSDLQTRPIFHYKEEPIKLHILICFIALVISKHVELKTGISIKRFTHECKKATSGRILNQITNKEIVLKAQPSTQMIEYLSKIITPH